VPRLYLFARLPDGVGDPVAASNDIEPALPGLRLISSARLHSTIVALDAAGVDQAHVAAMIDWIMATSPPFAFRLLFDQIVTSARQTLLRASEPLPGARDCQAHIVEMLRHYGLALSREAMPAPHITLGYGHRSRQGVRPIDGISWLVDELVLVRSWHGRTWHEELGRWRLPERRAVA
jgi:RNA 2',3'-cyclic 3'-phosphodiesterase